MRALIVDDEAPARAKLRRLLSAAPDVEIAGEASTGPQAVAAIKRSPVDVVFLDIQMPGPDGFGVLDAIAADAPHIVFVTADERSAIRAFEVGAVDYLLKPYSPSRFEQVLERARCRVVPPNGPASAPPAAPMSFLQRLLVIDDGRAAFLSVDRIDRIEADRNYLSIVSDGKPYRLRGTIAAIESRLDPVQFLRVNRSTLVRLDAVRAMHEWSHGDYRIIMTDGSEVTWTRRYRAAAERLFGIHG